TRSGEVSHLSDERRAGHAHRSLEQLYIACLARRGQRPCPGMRTGASPAVPVSSDRNRIFASWPVFAADEIEAATQVLRSGKVNYWTGEQGRAFEREYADYCGRTHGVALANGTVALELALRAFGVGPGDEVVVPARTFIATASAAVM